MCRISRPARIAVLWGWVNLKSASLSGGESYGAYPPLRGALLGELCDLSDALPPHRSGSLPVLYVPSETPFRCIAWLHLLYLSYPQSFADVKYHLNDISGV